jgi:hypothetical protein
MLRAGDGMTDARFPERWLNDRRILRLPDDAFRLFVNALLWSVANKTDGVLYDDDLQLIPGGRPVEIGADLLPVPGPERHLAKAGLWERVADYWQVCDFADTQSSRDELDALAARRRADRKRKAAERKRSASRDTSRDRSRDRPAERVRTGQDRTGALKGSGTCAENSCPSPPRSGCRTCWDHAYLEVAR